VEGVSLRELKEKVFKLLKEDEEFRYAVAGLIGLGEILKRLDRHEAELVRLRKDMVEGFRRRDEMFKKFEEEMARLRRDMMEGFKRHEEEIAKLRKDMMEGFKRRDEEMARLRRDMMEGFSVLRRHLDALGARWGMLAEEAFREGLRGVVEEELGLRVERWSRFDSEGYVFKYPSIVDVDVSVHDEKVVLVEIKSHVGKADVYVFKRKAEFYERVEGRKPARLIMITPYADREALEAAEKLGVEIYTKV